MNKIFAGAYHRGFSRIIIDCGPRDPVEIDLALRDKFYELKDTLDSDVQKEIFDEVGHSYDEYSQDVFGISRIVKKDNKKFLIIQLDPVIYTNRSGVEILPDRCVEIIADVFKSVMKEFYNISGYLVLAYPRNNAIVNIEVECDVEGVIRELKSMYRTELIKDIREILANKSERSLLLDSLVRGISDTDNVDEAMEIKYLFEAGEFDEVSLLTIGNAVSTRIDRETY